MLIGSQTLQSIVARQNVLPQILIVQIPTNRLSKTRIKRLLRRPIEFPSDLAGVDRVAEVVAGTVGDEGDEVGVAVCPLTLSP